MATAARKYDLYSDAFRADTYATFARMREQDPVFCQPGIDGETPIWWVTRYDDAEAVLLDDERFVRDPRLALTPDELAEFGRRPTGRDRVHRQQHAQPRRRRPPPPAPPRLEGVHAADDRALAAADPGDRRWADRPVVADDGEMELVSAFAFPLPITVIAELLGVPPADRDRFREWSDRDGQSSARRRRVGAVRRLDGGVRRLLCTRSSRSGGVSPGKTWSARSSRSRTAATRSPRRSCRAWSRLLIVAGHETTVSLIGNAMLALLTHPEQRAAIERDPSLLASRGRGADPLRRAGRADAEPVGGGGRGAPRPEDPPRRVGDRRPRRGRPRPGAVRGSRTRSPWPPSATTRHLGFGRGPHFCLGAPLARLEAEIALGTLLRRLPGLRLAVPPEELRWRPVPLFRSLVALPVAWDN